MTSIHESKLEANFLTIEEYARAQERAVRKFPLPLIASFQPVFFDDAGYQTRVTDEADLWKYIDSMSTPRTAYELSRPGGMLTEEEFGWCRVLATDVMEYGQRFYSRSSHSAYTTIRAAYLTRHLRYLYGSRPVRVLEVGPGNGFLGAMLLREGYAYAATDISQGLYLHQNRLWNFVTGGRVQDLARADASPALVEGGALHIPWWEYVAITPDSFPEFDVVTCNHAICEFSPPSLRFTLQLARQLLRGTGGIKLFMIEGWGNLTRNWPRTVTKAFYDAGFILVHNDPDLYGITAFAPEGTESAKGGTDQPFATREVVREIPGIAGGGKLPMPYELPGEYHSERNPASMAIIEGERRDADRRVIGIEEVRRFYTELLGSEKLIDPDHEWAVANWQAENLVGII